MSYQQPPGGYGPPPGYGPPNPYQPQHGFGPPQGYRPPQPPRKTPSMLVAGLVIVGLLVSCGVLTALTHETPKPEPKAPPTLEDKCGQHLTSSDCQDQMRGRLKDPDSAEFSGIIFGDRVITSADCSQVYFSHVEAKNGLGLMVRTNFICKYNPKTKKTSFDVVP